MANYTDQDTERARQAERAAGGLPAQNPLYPPSMAPMPRAPGRNNVAALSLIGVGLFMILSRLSPVHLEFEGGLILLTIASCFLFFSFWKRIYGLLIPGCILSGLSLGITFADLTGGASILWGLALGFLAILLLGRALFNQHSNWPIFPAVPLFGVGILLLASQMPAIFAGGLVWLPIMLIAAGLYMGWRRVA